MGTRHEPVSHEPLREAKRKIWSKPCMVGILAAEAELTEQEKERRDISRQRMGELFGADPRGLLTWADRCREEGNGGIRARGGAEAAAPASLSRPSTT